MALLENGLDLSRRDTMTDHEELKDKILNLKIESKWMEANQHQTTQETDRIRRAIITEHNTFNAEANKLRKQANKAVRLTLQ